MICILIFFLDDARSVKDVTWVELPFVTWTVVRSYDEFVSTINSRGLPEHVSFDSDLHESHYSLYIKCVQEGRINFPYDSCSPKTGWHCAKWLREYCLDKGLRLPHYTIHTLNRYAQIDIKLILSFNVTTVKLNQQIQ